MSAIPVNVRRVHATAAAPDLDADLRRARVLANLLDAKFSVMGVRFGLDAVLGLVPVVGDTLSAALSAYPIWVARRHRLGRFVQARMAVNVLIDWLPGMVPVVGDVIDVGFKANLRNVRLLEAAAEKKRRRAARKPAPAAPVRLKGKAKLLDRRMKKRIRWSADQRTQCS